MHITQTQTSNSRSERFVVGLSMLSRLVTKETKFEFRAHVSCRTRNFQCHFKVKKSKTDVVGGYAKVCPEMHRIRLTGDEAMKIPATTSDNPLFFLEGQGCEVSRLVASCTQSFVYFCELIPVRKRLFVSRTYCVKAKFHYAS